MPATLMQMLDELTSADLESAETWNGDPSRAGTTRLVPPPAVLPIPATTIVGLDLDGAVPTLSFLTDTGIHVHDLPAATTRMLDADLMTYLDEVLPARHYLHAHHLGPQLHLEAEGIQRDRTVRCSTAVSLAATAVHERRGTPATIHWILAAGRSPGGWIAGIVETEDGVVEVKSIATVASAEPGGLARAVETTFVRAMPEEGAERPTIDIVATLNRWDDPSDVQRLLPEPATEVERGDLVAEGLAWQSGVFTGEVTDLLLLDVIAEEVSIGVAGGPTFLAARASTTIPTRRSFDITIDAVGDRSLALFDGDVLIDRLWVPESMGEDVTATVDIDANAICHLDVEPRGD